MSAALAIAAIALAGGCGTTLGPGPRVAPVTPIAREPTELKVRVAGRIVTVAFEDYVAGTALSEISPVGESARTVGRIYDIQTIVARTYALAHLGRHRAEGFDLCDSTHCQLYEPARLGTSRFAADARRAVERTAGTVLLYNGRPIDALFHADCGGHTTSPEQVWGTPALPYLVPAPDRAPALTHRSWSVSVTREQLRIALNADPRTAVGRTLKSVTVDRTDSSGRAVNLELSGERRAVARSEDFRAVVNRTLGPKGIQSTRFTVKARGSNFVFTGTGFGHGVGLCQIGALARARLGGPVEAILEHYFPGTRQARLR